MTMTIEKSLKNFNFWGGAASNASKLTPDELDRLEQFIESLGEEPWSVTEINDMMWFSFENVCDWLDLDYEQVMARE